MFRKHQVNLFRDEAFFEVPDSTPQAIIKPRNAYACVHVCYSFLKIVEPVYGYDF